VVLRTYLVIGDDNVVILAEVAVDVFECSSGGFHKEEIDQRHERQVEDGPDDLIIVNGRFCAQGTDGVRT